MKIGIITEKQKIKKIADLITDNFQEQIII